MSSPAIYHGWRGAKRGYRYFQAGGREEREYVSPYGTGFGSGERVGMGGGSGSVRPVESIYDGEFGRPFARGAWGFEVRGEGGG